MHKKHSKTSDPAVGSTRLVSRLAEDLCDFAPGIIIMALLLGALIVLKTVQAK